MNRRHFLIALGGAALAACGAQPGGGKTELISVAELQQRMASQPGLLLIDVRTPAEFSGDGHIAGATLIPIQELDRRLAEIPRDRPVALICRSGNRSSQAAALLARNGYTQVSDVQGGMQAWARAGLPITR